VTNLPAAENVIFEDDFAVKLGDGWSWVKEDPENWRIESGKLQIRPRGGSSWAGSTDGKNYLVRKPPEVKGGELVIEVFAEIKPTQPFEHAGLMWYYDDDNYVTINKELFGGKNEVLFVIEKARAGRPPYGEISYKPDGIWLRLRIAGSKVIGEYRATPEDQWQAAGSRELEFEGEPRICLHAGYSPKNDPDRWASFSHFRILQVEK
jgi:hypothetical protein